MEDRFLYAQFCTDGEAEATYEKLSSLCYKIAQISNQLSDNLILHNEYY